MIENEKNEEFSKLSDDTQTRAQELKDIDNGEFLYRIMLTWIIALVNVVAVLYVVR